MGEQFEVQPGTENVLAEITGGACFGQRRLKAIIDLEDLAVDVVVAAAGETRDDHPFDHGVRIVTQDVAILEGSGFAFVAVADDVLLRRRLGHEAPLEAGREASAAAAAQHSGLHLGDDLIRGHLLGQDAPQRLVAAARLIVLDAPTGIALVPASRQQWIDRFDERHYLHSARSFSISSGVMKLFMRMSFTSITGASPQAPMHSPSLSVNLPSAVVSLKSMPSFCFR